jgi:hypothetical protein
MTILAKIGKFVKENKNELILFLAVVLISLLSFSFGYITAKTEEKKPLIIEEGRSLNKDKHISNEKYS